MKRIPMHNSFFRWLITVTWLTVTNKIYINIYYTSWSNFLKYTVNVFFCFVFSKIHIYLMSNAISSKYRIMCHLISPSVTQDDIAETKLLCENIGTFFTMTEMFSTWRYWIFIPIRFVDTLFVTEFRGLLHD